MRALLGGRMSRSRSAEESLDDTPRAPHVQRSALFAAERNCLRRVTVTRERGVLPAFVTFSFQRALLTAVNNRSVGFGAFRKTESRTERRPSTDHFCCITAGESHPSCLCLPLYCPSNAAAPPSTKPPVCHARLHRPGILVYLDLLGGLLQGDSLQNFTPSPGRLGAVGSFVSPAPLLPLSPTSTTIPPSSSSSS